MDYAAGIHAANLLDFGQRHRLPVGNHRQGFERRLGEPDRRLQALHIFPQDLVVLGLGGELVTIRYLPDLNPVLVLLVVGGEFVQLGLDPLALLAFQGLQDCLDRDRFRRHVDDALDEGLENVVV